METSTKKSENYKGSREWTDENHALAELKIYAPYGIEILKPATKEDIKEAEYEDIFHAIDYVGKIEKTGSVFKIQERTREPKYKDFNDITIRLDRPDNPDPERKASEYYKLSNYFEKHPDEVFLMMYAVRAEDDDFQKHTIIDLRKLFELIKEEKIIIDDTFPSASSIITEDGIMVCPVHSNKDGSSNLCVFDVGQLVRKFPGVVIAQSGFNAPEIPLNPVDDPAHFYQHISGSATVRQRNYIDYLCNIHNLKVEPMIRDRLSIRKASAVIQSLLYDSAINSVREFPKLLKPKEGRERPVQRYRDDDFDR